MGGGGPHATPPCTLPQWLLYAPHYVCASQSIGYLGVARLSIPVRRNTHWVETAAPPYTQLHPNTCPPVPHLVPSVTDWEAAVIAPAEMEEEPKPIAAPLAPFTPLAPAPAPAPAEPTPAPAPMTAPEAYEVQGCDTDCDHPCNKPCGQTWEDCFVVQEYSGTYDLRLADCEDSEPLLPGVLKRHVRRKGEVQQTKRTRPRTS